MASFDMRAWLFGSDRPLIGVLDVGAVPIEGQAPPYDKLVKAGSARIVGFEPDAAGCALLNEKFGPPHRFYPHFIGEGGPATFYETNWGPTGSLLKPNRLLLETFNNLHEVMTLKAEHPVETKRLDDLDGLGDIDFIKLDVQGAELAVLRGGAQVLRDAVMVQTEVEFVQLYEGQPLFADVDRVMRDAGYQFHTFAGFGSRCFKPLVLNGDANLGIRQFLWSDAIYVKDWLRLDAMSIEKMEKLAILAHEVLGSCDLCHFVLNRLDARGGTNFGARYLDSITAKSAAA